MRIKQIFFGIVSGWFVLSLAVLGYVTLKPPEAPHRSAAQRKVLSAVVANPPGVGSETSDENSDPELAALVYRYCPVSVSQHFEEVFIRDYFEDRKGGFFLDVGANHYKTQSTTYYMDTALGWHGIAIDAIAEFAEGYAKHRPRTKFFPVFVGDKSDKDVDFFVILNNSRLSTGNKETAEQQGAYEKRPMKTVTLNSLLDSQKVTKIDLLSMDIELWEPQALAGFDIERFKPELVVIEAHAQVKDKVFSYFAAHNYVEIEKYSKWDGRNVYFIPRDRMPAFLARKGIESAAIAAPTAIDKAASTASAR
jgi:FkbM family methyltransferase